MKVYLNDEKKSVDPRLHLKRVGIISRDHCGIHLLNPRLRLKKDEKIVYFDKTFCF